ncbi:MAG: hypothetical protein GF317_01335 [Candidatus Lokiarchaeota archaeon]|nr:hypothetical protein [Candidatus Lokiarchaeota archaeon]MBD3198587.1 hypothetical protein [Candidatus Lokiarchaeota archaeon]
MSSKGKYQLFTYKLDEYLIFYPSLNSNRKIMAFSVISVQEVIDLIEILKEYVEKRIIYYYSVQIDFDLQKTMIICFRDEQKENIIKSFYILKNQLDSFSKKIHIYANKLLESKFFDLMIDWNDHNIEINQKINALDIINRKRERNLKMYYVDLRLNNDYDNGFLVSFIKILKNYFTKGVLIFNFKHNSEKEYVFSPFLLLLLENYQREDAENLINDIYEYRILSLKKLYLEDIILIIWRISDSYETKNLKSLMEIFNKNHSKKKEIYRDFLYKLKKKFSDLEIKYHHINDKLILIEKKDLIVIVPSLKYNDIREILEKFYPKYSISLITFNKLDHENISKIDKIRDLKRLNIIYFEDFEYDLLKFN